MHLRRALLLFAIVLGLAALVASVTGPARDTERDRSVTTPPVKRPAEATDRPARTPPAMIVMNARKPSTRRLRAGRPATVTVMVARAGQVEIPTLGLSATADPHTPARFEVLEEERGSYEVSFTPAASGERIRVGTLLLTRGSPGSSSPRR